MRSDSQPAHPARIASRRQVECLLYYSDGQFYASGIAQDITTDGVRVRGTRTVQQDTNLVIFMLPPGSTPTLLIRRATVRWVRGTTFGLALTQLSATSQAELNRLAAIYLPGLWSSLN